MYIVHSTIDKTNAYYLAFYTSSEWMDLNLWSQNTTTHFRAQQLRVLDYRCTRQLLLDWNHHYRISWNMPVHLVVCIPSVRTIHTYIYYMGIFTHVYTHKINCYAAAFLQANSTLFDEFMWCLLLFTANSRCFKISKIWYSSDSVLILNFNISVLILLNFNIALDNRTLPKNWARPILQFSCK